MKLCDYGCGKEATYPFKNDKWCCSKKYNSCPKSKEKNSKIQKEIHNLPEIKTKHSKTNKLTIKQIQKRYPTFTKEEEMRYGPDGEIQVHCKYNECKNSKENGGWFNLTYGQFLRRKDALEHDDGNDGSYFYCSEECKQGCCLFNLYTDPNRLKEFEKYYKIVNKETYITKKKFFYKIENIELQGKKHKYALDHKYSIYDGFKNNIDPKIIGHYKNLECISESENLKKNRNSSITLEELLTKINEEDE